MSSHYLRLFYTKRLATTTIIRFMVGAVFLSEGIQKFLYPELRGVGRFRDAIELPYPEFLGYWVASWEVLCGALILVGLATRLAVIPTIIIMCVALATTKFVMLGDATLAENVARGSYEDSPAFRFWYMAHAMRTDFCMLLGSIFLLIKGGGFLSFDGHITAVKTAKQQRATSRAGV